MAEHQHEERDCERSTPWENGTYLGQSVPSIFIMVHGGKVTLKGPMLKKGDESNQATLKLGDFGESHPSVAEATGKQYNNVKLKCAETCHQAPLMDMEGVLSQDGKKMTFWCGFSGKLDAYTWMNQQQIIEWEHSRDSAEAPSSHYKLQPHNQGKLIFISGCVCMGKSTTGLYLSKMGGYVYYEADCFMWGTNPYLPPDTREPTVQALQQKPLKDMTKERTDAVANGMNELLALLDEKDYEEKLVEAYYTELCKDIVKERKRIGGDLVVATIVPKRALRDVIRKNLGPDLDFVLLNMSKEDHKVRVQMRSPDAEELNKKLFGYYDVFEPMADDEKQVMTVDVTLEMTKKDVAEKILEMINELPPVPA